MPGVEIWAGTVDPKHDGEVGTTNAGCVDDVGAMDAEQFSSRRKSSKAILEM